MPDNSSTNNFGLFLYELGYKRFQQDNNYRLQMLNSWNGSRNQLVKLQIRIGVTLIKNTGTG